MHILFYKLFPVIVNIIFPINFSYLNLILSMIPSFDIQKVLRMVNLQTVA